MHLIFFIAFNHRIIDCHKIFLHEAIEIRVSRLRIHNSEISVGDSALLSNLRSEGRGGTGGSRISATGALAPFGPSPEPPKGCKSSLPGGVDMSL